MQVQKSFAAEAEAGTLYLVGTPIGNLDDMTFRAVETLKKVDWIAAEDTRQTRKLLTHFDIQTRLVSYHEHNKQASGPELLRFLREGQSVALVSDAGLPAISDPGEDLVRQAAEEGIRVVPVPGANAALSALIVSGLPTDRFLFAGFLPRDRKSQAEQLRLLGAVPATLLFYESPHRVAKTLRTMREELGDRQVALVRELTKRYEEVARGSLDEALLHLEAHPPQGEYVIVLGRAAEGEGEAAAWWAELSVDEHVRRYEDQGEDRKTAMKKAAQDRGVSKRDIYNALL
ncbi:ribosomal RNA small subunit methyltransferase I [Paenibacillus sp. J31TS4]|uniref:16S rRNA (cytidine(1402)-2'-O)-methyltransferase n=1 Tax=Paenibacillus sp. J31TS4 TaxID=2807195 RepID=UPI001B03ADF9|nr:16S rRNA (cytidine(1402)-2'-O)-methyltransferase [Paenibacillus sp. J31TS4]GIP41376.1 ribosomal RNA small subunit methyltransferase I [Paenibacillus sp. J31TS4]